MGLCVRHCREEEESVAGWPPLHSQAGGSLAETLKRKRWKKAWLGKKSTEKIYTTKYILQGKQHLDGLALNKHHDLTPKKISVTSVNFPDHYSSIPEAIGGKMWQNKLISGSVLCWGPLQHCARWCCNTGEVPREQCWPFSENWGMQTGKVLTLCETRDTSQCKHYIWAKDHCFESGTTVLLVTSFKFLSLM